MITICIATATMIQSTKVNSTGMDWGVNPAMTDEYKHRTLEQVARARALNPATDQKFRDMENNHNVKTPLQLPTRPTIRRVQDSRMDLEVIPHKLEAETRLSTSTQTTGKPPQAPECGVCQEIAQRIDRCVHAKLNALDEVASNI